MVYTAYDYQENYDDIPEELYNVVDYDLELYEQYEDAYYEEEDIEEEQFYTIQEDDLLDMDDPEWKECYATYTWMPNGVLQS